MSNSSSDAIIIAYLNNILSGINFYFGMFIFFFGIVGNILNILILSQRPLRSNPCVVILLAASITGIIVIMSGLISRVLSGATADLSATINWICKLRGVVLYSSRATFFWLIMLATIDRWAVSSIDVHHRNMSSKKNAFRGIVIISVSSSLIHSQLFYCYEANLIGTPLKCYTRNLGCGLMNDLTFAIVSVLSPLMFIAIFGWMTILNTRRARGRVGLMTAETQSKKTTGNLQRSKKTDQRLLVMLFVQVILLALFALPLAIDRLYTTFAMNIPKSALRITIENFVYQVAAIFTYFAAGTPFYVNTLSGGSVFRKAMVTLKELIIRKIMCR